MRPLPPTRARRGSILPIMAMFLPVLCTLTAMALDLGVLAVSRTNCQSAADSAALVATRTLDNKPTSVNSNQAAATTAATAVVTQNNLASRAGDPNTITVEYGLYKYYDTTTTPAENPPKFDVKAWYPAGSSLPNGEKSWTASKVTVTSKQPSLLSSMMGVTNLNTYAYAVAVYRPRDIAMTLDMTGSMKFGCMVRGNDNFMSCDPLYPQAGHWARYVDYTANNPGAGTNSGGSPSGRQNPLFTTASYNWGQVYAPSNITVNNAGGPPAVKDFFYDPSNVGSPATSVVTPTVANLVMAFHHWDPTVTSPGSPDTYVAATNDYSNWATSTTPLTAGTYSLYPAPEFFKDQTDSQMIGDRYPRKRGAERTASPGTWDATAANGAAYTLAEYLGWSNRYTSGNPTSATAGFGPPGTGLGRTDSPALTSNASIGRGSLVPAAPLYATDWSNFRDATWETYGYDLNVDAYVANRGANWDPRNPPLGRVAVAATGVAAALPALPRLPSPLTTAGPPVAATATLVTPGRFKGYTVGPGYWGKSFFMWPPDPRPAQDWRRKFFFKTDAVANAAVNASQLDPAIDNNPTTTPAVDNIDQVLLRNGTGEALNLPGANQINYRAVLAWIKQPPLCLPPNLRAGRVVYYTSIPDDVTVTGTSDIDKDKAFWKAYIDYVMRDNNICEYESAGWPEGATPSIFQSAMAQYDIDGPGPAATSQPPDSVPYMNYLDNPSRPRANFWFGPITMLGLLGAAPSAGNANATQNAWAGTVHEAQTWQLKAGVNSVLDDIRNNHPNDNVGLSYFSAGGYGFTSVGCSQDFDLLKGSLFYPKPLVEDGSVWTNTSKEFRAFDTNMNYQGYNKVNNAQGGTDPNTGMATCFNILAPSTAAAPAQPLLPPAPYGTASASRRGRRGASKIVIFETDGVPNAISTTTRQDLGYNSYYAINVGSTATGQSWGSAAPPALAIVDQMLKPMASTTSGTSGLSSPSSPARVYAIGFGDLFNISPQPQTALDARTFLLQVQQRGGTSASTDAAIPAYQIITGPYQTRIDSLKTAFERILQSGVQVTLIE